MAKPAILLVVLLSIAQYRCDVDIDQEMPSESKLHIHIDNKKSPELVEHPIGIIKKHQKNPHAPKAIMTPIEPLAMSNPNKEPIPCKMDNGKKGECVPFYLCSENNTVITDGSFVLDVKFGESCQHYLDSCCMLDKKINPLTPKHGDDHIPPPIHNDHIPPPIHNDHIPPPTQGDHIPPPVHDDHIPPPTRDTNVGFIKSGCGMRNENGVGFRIKNEKDLDAQFGEFPWMVIILKEESFTVHGKNMNTYQCGGSLIHPKVVLTAAHCVAGLREDDPMKLKVRAGEWDTQTKNEILPHQDRFVAKIIHHEYYNPGSLHYDIAVLILESPVDYAENVGVVCLPPPDTKPPLTYCLATGWGKNDFKKGAYSAILKKLELPIVEHHMCQAALRTTRLGIHFQLHETFICAGGEHDRDTCTGDGGSPLVCPMPKHPDRYMQSGIVDWGIGCGSNNIPGVYVNVAILKHWIDEKMHLNGIDLTPYQHF